MLDDNKLDTGEGITEILALHELRHARRVALEQADVAAGHLVVVRVGTGGLETLLHKKTW